MNSARKISATITAAAAGNYGAADVISNSASDGVGVAAEFAGAAPKEASVVTIFGAQIRVNAPSMVAQLRLHLFSRAPVAAEVEMDDNIAFSIKTTAGQDIYLGSLTFAALANPGGTLFAFADLDAAAAAAPRPQMLGKPVELGAEETSLYGVLETIDAEVNEVAGMDVDIDLYVY